MEKSKLDFNAPLLSARRFSTARNSSADQIPFEPELLNKSGDLTKLLAAVPFNWEQTPGRRKNAYLTRDTSGDNARLSQNLNDSLSSIDESYSSQSEEVSTVPNSLSLREIWLASKPKPSEEFGVDKQTLGFLMTRSLPAAKAAVVLETPQKKKVVINEKPKEIKKVVITEKPKEIRKKVKPLFINFQ